MVRYRVTQVSHGARTHTQFVRLLCVPLPPSLTCCNAVQCVPQLIELLDMGRYRGIGMPRAKKKKVEDSICTILKMRNAPDWVSTSTEELKLLRQKIFHTPYSSSLTRSYAHE